MLGAPNLSFLLTTDGLNGCPNGTFPERYMFTINNLICGGAAGCSNRRDMGDSEGMAEEEPVRRGLEQVQEQEMATLGVYLHSVLGAWCFYN